MSEDFTLTFRADDDPIAVTEAIGRPKTWWNDLIEGSAAAVGDEFAFHMPGVHSTRMRVTAIDPGREVVWHVLENRFAFVDDQSEWVGSDVRFALAPDGDGTRVTVTHAGLTPDQECWELCSAGWTHHLTVGLRELASGRTPQPMTADDAVATAQRFVDEGYTKPGR